MPILSNEPAPPGRGLLDRTLSAMSWQFSSKLFEAVGRLLVMIVLARLLSPHAFGVASASVLVTGFSSTLAQLGVSQALIQRRELKAEHIGAALCFGLMTSLATSLLLFSAAQSIAAFFHMPELRAVIQLTCLVLPVTAAAGVAEALLSRRLAFGTISLIDTTSFAVGFGACGIGFALLGWGLWALVGAQVCYLTLRGLCLLLACPRISIGMSLTGLRDLLGFGTGHAIAELGNFAALQGDNAVVGRYMGAIPLGIYERSYALMAQPTRMIGLVFDLVLFPALSEVQDDRARMRRTLYRSLAGIAILTAPISLMMAVLAVDFIKLAFGEKWVGMTPVFGLFAASLMFRTSYKVLDAVARAAGASYRRAWRQWVYAAMVGIAAWFGHFYGLVGVALGVSVAIFLNFALMLHLSLRLVEGRWLEIAKLYARLAAGLLPTTIIILVLGSLAHREAIGPAATLGVTAMGAFVGLSATLLRFEWIFGSEAAWICALIRTRVRHNKIFGRLFHARSPETGAS